MSVNTNLAVGQPLIDFEAAIELPPRFSLAACRNNSDPTLFDGDELLPTIEAKKVCSTCPISQLCLDWAVANEDYGVWGGTTPAERKKLRGNKPVRDIILERQLLDDENFILTNTAAKVAEHFEVTERTVCRWRARIRLNRKAS